MVLSAFLVCLSHGSNDVANAISPLIVVLRNEGMQNQVSFLIGSAGIALGLFISGKHVMETVGEKIVQLDFQKGFSAQFATATSICLGSSFGLPLSTTHCMIGAMGGIYVASFTESVNRVYWLKDKQSKESEGKINGATIKKILFWWGITIPVALFFTSFITYILLNIF